MHLVGFIIRIYHDARSHERRTIAAHVYLPTYVLVIFILRGSLATFYKMRNVFMSTVTEFRCVDDLSLLQKKNYLI